MKNKLLLSITLTALLIPAIFSAQAPSLGMAAGFALFTANGAVTNSGISQVTGNVGTNNGSSTGFGNVNGTMHDNDGTSAQCATDVLNAYNQLNNTIANFFPSSLLGNGQTLLAGVYSISSASVLNLNLNLDAQGDSNAVFIFKIQGTFSTNAASKVRLINGAQACNVFWKVEGMVSMGAGTFMRGTIIANNAAISMNTGDTLEGRALSTTGAITTNGVMTYTPIGCGSPVLTGPAAPPPGTTACYALFSSSGAVSNSGISNITGDVGTNSGLTTGFSAANVNGTIHTIPDASTAQCASDLSIVYNNLNMPGYDIELLYPAQFGNNLVLTPHTYLLDAATVLTDTVYLNAQGNPNAVFLLKINGAFSTSTFSRVVLINGTQSKNVYWKVEGAVSINDFSTFRGTLVCHNGAMSGVGTGVTIDGRILNTTGALTTSQITANAPAIPGSCQSVGIPAHYKTGELAILFPNPFQSAFIITLNDELASGRTECKIYNLLGEQVIDTILTKKSTSIDASALPPGFYTYTLVSNNQVVQTGRLIAQQ